MSTSQGSVAGKTNTDTAVPFGKGHTIDRLALQKDILKRLPKAENENNIILTLLNDAFWCNITADPRIKDANGNPFKDFAAWFAFILKDYPTSKEMFSKAVVKKLLSMVHEDGTPYSVRLVQGLTGWSRGYVHDVNQERQGKPTEKQKRAARKTAAEKQAKTPAPGTPAESPAGTPKLEITDQGSEERKQAYAARLVAAMIPLAAKCVDVVADMDAETLALWLTSADKQFRTASNMTKTHTETARLAEVKANQAPKPAAPKPAAPVKVSA